MSHNCVLCFIDMNFREFENYSVRSTKLNSHYHLFCVFIHRYGGVMTVYLGSRCTVMLNSYDAIKEAFVKYGHVFSGRPQDLFFITDISEGLGNYKICLN